MKEELEQEQRMDEPTQPFAGAPGVPGSTPNYLEQFPIEQYNNTTTYDSKNAIWDSGSPVDGFKNISFAGSMEGGLQFKADTSMYTTPPGYPGNPDQTKVFVRSKRQQTSSYRPWYELYHKGNLSPSLFASKSSLDAKADKTYVDSQIALKADKTYVDTQCAMVSGSNTATFDLQIKNLQKQIDSIETRLILLSGRI